MNNRERVVIYAALGALAALNLAALSGEGTSPAHAGAAAAPDQLGPTDTLTLVEEEQNLVLRNRQGRLSWSDSAHARAYSVGFVHVGKILQPLLRAEGYVEEYRRMEEEIRAGDEELSEGISAFEQEHRDLAPDDPDAEDVRRAYQELIRNRERYRRQGGRRLGTLHAGQIERAYRDFVAAVEVVADHRQIDIVFRFIPIDNEMQTAAPAQAYTAIQSRIAIKYPDGLDITDDVLEELALEVE